MKQETFQRSLFQSIGNSVIHCADGNRIRLLPVAFSMLYSQEKTVHLNSNTFLELLSGERLPSHWEREKLEEVFPCSYLTKESLMEELNSKEPTAFEKERAVLLEKQKEEIEKLKVDKEGLRQALRQTGVVCNNLREERDARENDIDVLKQNLSEIGHKIEAFSLANLRLTEQRDYANANALRLERERNELKAQLSSEEYRRQELEEERDQYKAEQVTLCQELNDLKIKKDVFLQKINELMNEKLIEHSNEEGRLIKPDPIFTNPSEELVKSFLEYIKGKPFDFSWDRLGEFEQMTVKVRSSKLPEMEMDLNFEADDGERL